MAKMRPLASTLFVPTLTLFVFMASSSWGLWESENLQPSDYHSPTACMDSLHTHPPPVGSRHQRAARSYGDEIASFPESAKRRMPAAALRHGQSATMVASVSSHHS